MLVCVPNIQDPPRSCPMCSLGISMNFTWSPLSLGRLGNSAICFSPRYPSQAALRKPLPFRHVCCDPHVAVPFRQVEFFESEGCFYHWAWEEMRSDDGSGSGPKRFQAPNAAGELGRRVVRSGVVCFTRSIAMCVHVHVTCLDIVIPTCPQLRPAPARHDS